jgi:hypothetical protein
MQRIFGLPFCLLGLLAALVSFAGCGQNEGGRCQVTSDCASGLVCDSNTGNGRCRSQSSVAPGSDAASARDEAEDQPVVSGPEVGEVGIDAVVTTESDAVTLDTAAVTLEAGAVDSGSQASTD